MACYATGMSKDMKRKFNFVNIAGNAFTEIDSDALHIVEFEAGEAYHRDPKQHRRQLSYGEKYTVRTMTPHFSG